MLHLESEIIHTNISATGEEKMTRSNYINNKLSQKHVKDIYQLRMGSSFQTVIQVLNKNCLYFNDCTHFNISNDNNF